MRRQSLRPRQIDVHARMRIIRSQEDLVVDEDAAAGAPSTTFEELVAHLDEQSQPASHKQRRKKNIPIPVTLDVRSYEDEVPADFEVPTSYVRHQTLPTAPPPPTQLPMTTTATATTTTMAAAAAAGTIPVLVDPEEPPKVELDMELAEIKWLKYHPKYGDDGDPRYQLPLWRFALMLDALERACAIINPNVLTLAEAEEVFAKQLGMVKTPLNKVTVDVYNYWVQKRQALKRPLVRKYWPQTPLNDTNPHLVFRPREKERYKLRKHRKNDMEGYRKLQQLRADFERVRHLLDLVKRRERAKRLEVDFLDEIRRQAVYELTDRSGVKRKPILPTDEERDRHKLNKKKKKKKHRKDGEKDDDDHHHDGITDGADGPSNTASGDKAAKAMVSGNASSSATAMVAADTVVKMPTFMDYDTSENYCPDQDIDLREPSYPSYPPPQSHFLASVFSHPPKYRCRGRVGRGGRLVIDRIPVPGSRYFSPNEVMATPRKFPTTGGKVQPGMGGSSTTAALGEPINNGLHTAILVHETSFRPHSTKLDHLASTRLQEIYAMSDSEDELFEPLTSAVYELAATRKASNAAKANLALPPRAVKYAVEL